MDIITHTLSGLAVGTVAISYTNKDVKAKLGLLTLSAFAAALPDLDAISLWSGFDATIGSTFGLRNPGSEIYFAKFWYSHHAFLHSLTAGILIAMLLFLIYHILKTNYSNASGWGAGHSLKTGDYGDILSDMELIQISKLGVEFNEIIHKIEISGFYLFGLRRKLRLRNK